MRTAAFSLLGLTLALLVFGPAGPDGASHASPIPAGDYITGKVTSGNANPVHFVWVLAYDGTSLKGRSLTGNDGRYYIGALEDKTYTIVVRKQAAGNNVVSQSVSLPQDRIHDIRLP